jgi:hypothetical protein
MPKVKKGGRDGKVCLSHLLLRFGGASLADHLQSHHAITHNKQRNEHHQGYYPGYNHGMDWIGLDWIGNESLPSSPPRSANTNFVQQKSDPKKKTTIAV